MPSITGIGVFEGISWYGPENKYLAHFGESGSIGLVLLLILQVLSKFLRVFSSFKFLRFFAGWYQNPFNDNPYSSESLGSQLKSLQVGIMF